MSSSCRSAPPASSPTPRAPSCRPTGSASPTRTCASRPSDGLELEGWYVPSRNGAAVIAFPGRNGPQKQARMLAAHGYGVLLFDRRGEGRSDGDPNAFGWGGDRDVKAAIAYLQQRPDVDPDRIGGIGLSVGGELMLEAAAETDDLRAVVSEGAGARMYSEEFDQDFTAPASMCSTPRASCSRTSVSASSATSRRRPTSRTLVGRIAPRPLLLIAAPNSPNGEELNVQYHAAADEPKELWEIPESGHTGGIDGAAGGVRAPRGRLLRPEPRAMTERRVFTVATVVLLVHAVDDALVHRQPGLGAGQHVVAALVALVAGGAAIAAFPALRPGLRAAAAGLLGAFGLVNGAMHVQHVRADAVAGSDLTGVVAVAAAARAARPRRRDPVRHRGEREHGRWRARAVALPAALLALDVVVVAPSPWRVVDAHKWREPIGAAAERGVRAGRLRRRRRPAPRGLVPPVAQRRRDAGRPRRQQRPHRGARPRAAPRPRTATASCSTTRGAAARARAPRAATAGAGARTSTGALRLPRRAGRRRPGRVAALGISTGADILLDVAADRPSSPRSSPTAPPPDLAGRPAPRRPDARVGRRLADVPGDRRSSRESRVPASSRTVSRRARAAAADLGRPRRGARLQRPLRRGRGRARRALEHARREPHPRPARPPGGVRAARAGVPGEEAGPQSVIDFWKRDTASGAQTAMTAAQTSSV